MKIFKSFFFVFITTSLIYSQSDIVNTLGTGGIFSIKNGSTTFFSLSQSDGRITLPVTTSPSNLGVIFKGTNSFIHDFAPSGALGNTFVGISAGNFTMSHSSGIDASYNTGVGQGALVSLSTGYSNIAIGDYSLNYNSTGSNNTASGYQSLLSNTSGNNNTAMGSFSLWENITGSDNTAVGYYSLHSNTAGFQNTSVGHHSLQNNNGNYNTALGYNAGSSVTTGANLTLLGIDANPSSGTAINQITLGNTFVTSLRCNVQNISSLSDARDKKNIKDLNLGIDFLMKLKPRIFNWDRREWYDDNKSDGSKMKEEPTAGFIAQELDEAQTSENSEWLNLVLKDNPEKLEATPGNLLPIIVKAIQDLKKENDELKATNTELITKLDKFEQIENMLVSEIEKLKTNSNETTKVSLGEQ